MGFTKFGIYIRTVFQMLSKGAFTLHTAGPNIGMGMVSTVIHNWESIRISFYSDSLYLNRCLYYGSDSGEI